MTGSHEASDPESEAGLLNDNDAFIDTAQTASSEILSRPMKDTAGLLSDFWRAIK